MCAPSKRVDRKDEESADAEEAEIARVERRAESPVHHWPPYSRPTVHFRPVLRFMPAYLRRAILEDD
ncbi:hypothetical protein M3Y99_01453100 [Aphelenchoides fujianensis]|nr:hypothetical protein M3Y99_01453100 [Aphelenchoides fujianensis]